MREEAIRAAPARRRSGVCVPVQSGAPSPLRCMSAARQQQNPCRIYLEIGARRVHAAASSSKATASPRERTRYSTEQAFMSFSLRARTYALDLST